MSFDPINYWRLCDELTLKQAALLTVNVDPSGESGSRCEELPLHERPRGYDAAKAGVMRAIRCGAIQGQLIPHYIYNSNNKIVDETDEVDIDASVVEVQSLRTWLASRGYKAGFFFPVDQAPDFANGDSQYYAPALAAAVAAWEAVSGDPSLTRGKKPKQAMVTWLRKNASRYGLLDDEGNPREKRIDELAAFANWDKTPGAAKTPDSPL